MKKKTQGNEKVPLSTYRLAEVQQSGKYDSKHKRPRWGKTGGNIFDFIVEYLLRLITLRSHLEGAMRHHLTETGGNIDLKQNLISMSETVGPLRMWRKVLAGKAIGTKTSKDKAVDFLYLGELSHKLYTMKSWPDHLKYARFSRIAKDNSIKGFTQGNEMYDFLYEYLRDHPKLAYSALKHE